MPQGRKRKQPESAAAVPIEQPKRRNRFTPYIIAAAVVVALLAMVSVPYYQQYIAPFRQVIITVDSTVIRMNYFMQRIRAANSDGFAMITQITNELLIKSGAPRYGITVTDTDVDDYLHKIAAGSDNHTVSEIEFREWYRQALNESKLSDQRYREMVTVQIYSERLQKYLADTMPKEVDHVLVYALFTSSYDAAIKAKERWTAGEDFSKLATELSIDGTTQEKGGEIGWLPEGASIFDLAFDMNVGEVSDPAVVPGADPTADPTQTPQTYYIIYIKDKAVRPIESQYLASVEAKVYQDWLTAEHDNHTVKWNFNSEINAWINWQIAKAKGPSSSSSSSG